MAKGKRIRNAYDGIDRDAFYGIDDAVKMIKERASAKFDETIELSMNLGSTACSGRYAFISEQTASFTPS